ncbi:25058_t:CDS:2, partial [Gigaspora rosea]
FLENLTDDKKRNQIRRRLQDGFKFSSEQVSILIPNQRSSKTKVINLATSDSYQIPYPTPQNSEETIREMVHRIMRDNLSASVVKAEAHTLANSAPNANAGSSHANEIQRDRCKFVEAFEKIDYPDHFTLESVKERLDKYDISTLPNLQAFADVMIMLCDPGAVYAVVVHGAKNLAHAMTIAEEALCHNPDNNTSPTQNYVIVNYRRKNQLPEEARPFQLYDNVN